jgi:hypothetical protein
MRIQPEISLGKIGFGLDVPLFFSLQDGSFRTQEFQDGILGVLRMVRYFRYGRKGRDPLFFRLGDLSQTYFGGGGLINNYTNSPSFERRKVGILFDVRPNKMWGVEGMYSDFSTTGLFAVRPYVRPLANLPIPIINTMEVGATYAGDYTQQLINFEGELEDARFVNKGMNAFGADLGFVIFNTDFLNLRLLGQFNYLARNSALASFVTESNEEADVLGVDRPFANGYDAGIGASVGAVARMKFIANIFSIEARLERLWYGNNYIPQFFDAFYAINPDDKILRLANAEGVQGIYGSLGGVFLNKIRLTGGLQVPDLISEANPAFIFFTLDPGDIIPKIIFNANYFKGGLTTFNDALVLDQRSLATALIAYKIKPFLAAGVQYRWTFALTEVDGVEQFRATSMVMPYVGLTMPLGFLNGN